MTPTTPPAALPTPPKYRDSVALGEAMTARDDSIPVGVGIYYDFASSLCFMAHRIMERLAPELSAQDISLFWMPLDLTAMTDWRRGDPIRGERRQKILQVSRDLDVEVTAPGHWMDSRAAMAVAIDLAESEHEAAWREAVWSRVYERGECLDSLDLLAEIADELGLGGVSCELDPSRLSRLQEETRRAAASGVCGVPTFMLDIWPVGGIQDEATMRTFLGRWAEKCRAGETGIAVN